MLSIGLVSDDGQECYAELATNGSHLAGADGFNLSTVVSQFGRVPGAGLAGLTERGEGVGRYLRSFPGPFDLCYDYKLVWRHLVSLVASDTGLLARMHAVDISGTLGHESSDVLYRSSALFGRGLGQHHALADAHMLRAAWQAISVKQR